MSFSLYLFHYPLLIFAAATVPFNHTNATQSLSVAGVILIVVGLLSKATEAQRPTLHRCLEKITAKFWSPKQFNSHTTRLPAKH